MKKIKEPSMSRGGVAPLATVHVNGTYILGIYQGKLSEYDIVLRYRQKENGNGVGYGRQSIYIGLSI